LRLFLLFQPILFLTISFGQSTSNVVNVSSSDGLLKSMSIHSFSIGEPIISSIQGQKTILSQGFLQPIGQYFLLAKRDTTPCYTLKIWPNPASYIINISLDPTKNCAIYRTDLRVISSNGAVILTQLGLEGTNVIECRNWASGIYFFELLNNGKKNFVSKVVVIH